MHGVTESNTDQKRWENRGKHCDGRIGGEAKGVHGGDYHDGEWPKNANDVAKNEAKRTSISTIPTPKDDACYRWTAPLDRVESQYASQNCIEVLSAKFADHLAWGASQSTVILVEELGSQYH